MAAVDGREAPSAERASPLLFFFPLTASRVSHFVEGFQCARCLVAADQEFPCVAAVALE